MKTKFYQLFLIPFLMASIASCSLMKSPAKYAFTDGVYRARVSQVPTRRVYLEVEEDSVKIFPLVPGGNGVQIDTSKQVILLFPQYRSRNSFQNVTFFRPSFDLDGITVPVKYRPPSMGFPRQLVSTIEAALYLGYRVDAYRLHYRQTPRRLFERDIHHLGFSAGFFTGLGSTDIFPWLMQDQIGYEYSGVAWTKGIAGVVAVDNLTLGLVVGIDYLLDRNRHFWIYQNKPWIGFAFGLNLN